jgi:hypothetical protein
MTPAQFRSQGVFLRLQNALYSLEQEMKPLRSEMSMECQFELECLGKIARSFFKMANQELFSKKQVKEVAG